MSACLGSLRKDGTITELWSDGKEHEARSCGQMARNMECSVVEECLEHIYVFQIVRGKMDSCEKDFEEHKVHDTSA